MSQISRNFGLISQLLHQNISKKSEQKLKQAHFAEPCSRLDLYFPVTRLFHNTTVKIKSIVTCAV